MVGLKDIHKLTSTGKYKLRVDLKDYYSCYYAEYDNFQVMQYVSNHANWVFYAPPSLWKNMKDDDGGDGDGEVVDNDCPDFLQVGPADGYVLSAYGFNYGLSNTVDALAYHNGMKFSAW